MTSTEKRTSRLFDPDKACLAIAFILLIAKHMAVTQLPIEARAYSVDDLLMVQMAEGLLDGRWLGSYSAVTLMKGSFFPMLLAGLHRLGIPYLSGLDLMYGCACLFFVRQMRHIIRRPVCWLLLFVLLLFDPCSYSLTNFQRVYRSSIVEVEVLFLFGAYFGLYFQYRDSEIEDQLGCMIRRLCYAVLCGLVLWANWNTREESVWMLPFVITATALVLREVIALSRKEERPIRFAAEQILILALPFFLLFAGNETIAQINRHVYGERVRLEEVDGSFGRALKTIYSIRNKEELPYCTVSREKLERLYAYSPSLAAIQTELDAQMNYYAAIDRNPEDDEVEDGWFFWGLKKAAFENGAADTLPKSQAYWLKVSRELEEAIDDPDSDLERQRIMPSALMSPWREEFGRQIIPSMASALRYTVSYREVGPSVQASGKANSDRTRQFEMITGNLAVYSDGFSEKLLAAQARRLQPVHSILTRVGDAYRAVNRYLAVIAVLAYGMLIVRFFKKKDRSLASSILIILGMGLSIAVMTAGVCYTDISAFEAIKYYYLIGVYPLMLACEGLAILAFIENINVHMSGRRISNETGT